MAAVTSPIFVDASGRRASGLRRVRRAAAALLAAYCLLLVASLARLPGTDRISLPGVGALFPTVIPSDRPHLSESARVVTERPGPSVGVAIPAIPATQVTPSATPTASPNAGAAAMTPAAAPAQPPLASPAQGHGPDGAGPPGQAKEHENSAGGRGNGQGNGQGNGRGNGQGKGAGHPR